VAIWPSGDAARGYAVAGALAFALGLCGAGLAHAASTADSAPIGLPPAPVYLPGTVITPAGETPKPADQDTKAPGQAATPPGAPQAVQVGSDPSTMPPLDARSAASGSGTVAEVAIWQKLAPLVPEPGHFAVVPGTELRKVLVRKDEFDFCAQIKCNRSAAVLGAWNGGAFDVDHGAFRAHGGGHADYGGNEVYAFDFTALRWTRETDPQPLTGPNQRDTNDDGQADACPAPATGPPATHTYQGFFYVPKVDRYWLLGTVGYCSEGMGGAAAWNYDAKSKTWTAMPELSKFAKFTRAVVDPASGNVVVHVGRERGWQEIDPTTRKVVRAFDTDSFGTYIDGPALFDGRGGRIFALIGGEKSDRLVAYGWPAPGQASGYGGRLIAEWPADGRKYWGMAQDKFGRLVLWDGARRITVVDADSGKSWEERTAIAAPMTDGDKPGKVYSKWAYIPALDAFFGVANADTGIVLYRLGGAVLPDVQPVQAVQPAEMVQEAQDMQQEISPAVATIQAGLAPTAPAPKEIEDSAAWSEVCASAILCDPMGGGDVHYRGRVVDSGPPERGDRNWRSIGQKFEHPQAEAPAPDPAIGGLRFTFPSHSGSGAAGNFKTDFSPDYSFQVGPADAAAPAQEAYIQFQVRYSCTFIWTDCDPQSANYRKERRCFSTKRGEGECTVSKIALISTGDREDFRADACTRIQIALNHDADHSLHAFNRCPQALGFGERLPRVNGKAQSNSQPGGLYFCPRILADGKTRGWNNTADTCFGLIDDRWITIQVHLKFGPWQGKKKKSDPGLSHVSIWAAVEGENGGRQRLVIDNDFAPTTPEHPNDYIGKIWLMPHLYDKTDREEHPTFYVWYRNLVISQSPIPNPQ
jgi:hypothetical protein